MKSERKCAKEKRENAHFRSIPISACSRSQGTGEDNFVVGHFVRLNVKHVALLRSVFCVVRSWNNNGKYMTKNLTFILTDRTFHFVWLPESIGKVRKCFFRSHFKPQRSKLRPFWSPWRVKKKLATELSAKVAIWRPKDISSKE